MTGKRDYRFGLKGIGVLAAGLLAAGSAGCASKYEDLKSFVQAHDQDVAATSYRIDPPDMLAIASPNCPEVDQQVVRVGVDGKVTLRLLGDVKVSSLTPREVASKLEDLLKRYYMDPKVDVQVAQYASKEIYVFGEVGAPGARPFTGKDTVLDVLAMSQPTRIAWGSQVKLIRPSASDKDRHEIVLDIDRMMHTGDVKENYLLQEGDIIYVPPTPMAWLGMRIQDVIFPFQAAANAYTLPIQYIAATDYYRDRSKGTTYVRLGGDYDNNGK